ncbi:MAG: cystathionine gamma-synthase [Anaerolineales bacterium]|nr:cystathionine gamma-synthase [Anaerolineales bacterium]
MKQSLRFETLAIHAGQEPDPATGAVMTPIYQTSTYKQSAVGEHRGFEYSRTGNPTRKALEDALAALEAGQAGFAFASGMAASDAVIHLLRPGDHILAVSDLYGGTYRIFEQVYRQYGLEFDYAKGTDPDELLEKVRPNTRMIWLESPTNPLLRIVDIKTIADEVGSERSRPWIVVDNTFATPYLQQPLQLGADIVVHSTTKYLGGHSDVLGGAVVVKNDELAGRLAFLQNAIGAVPGPMDCFLVLRGIKTLPVRMDRHARNAERIVQFLLEHPTVDSVFYPFSDQHPQRALAMQQMRNGGGMVSFIPKGGEEVARKIAEQTKIFTLAESLGGVESLIEIPARMTHVSTAGSGFEVDPALVRLSVGLESELDLLEDLKQALG